MNPVALITGSSRGIGRGIALELAKAATHDLVINYAGNEAAALECKALCGQASRPCRPMFHPPPTVRA